MKGIIFSLLEQMVEAEEDGERTWDELLEAADVYGGYSSLGSYPDHELSSLLRARSSQLGVPEQDVTRAFGHFALLGLGRRHPHFFASHRRTRDFLLTLNDLIHPEVRKLHADAAPPEFEFDDSCPDRLVIGYRSERRLCAFAEGMIAGAATYFGEEVHITQEQCVHAGADQCTLECTFHRRRDDGPDPGP